MSRTDTFRLTRLIKDLLATNKATIDAIGKNTEATKKATEKQARPPSRIAVDVNIPREEIGNYCTERNKPNGLQWWAFAINFLTLLAVAWYAIIADQQRKIMLEANRINADALTSVQRAFVYLNGFQASLNIDQNGKPIAMRIAPQWKNSGATRAIDARSWINHYPREIPPGFTYPDYDGAGHLMSSDVGSPIFLAPQSTVFARPHDVTIEEARSVQLKARAYHFYGWVKYRDVFTGTKGHITRFCYKVEEIRGDLTRNASFDINLIPCQDPKRNCADEECKEP